jgi:hypothetical protein
MYLYASTLQKYNLGCRDISSTRHFVKIPVSATSTLSLGKNYGLFWRELAGNAKGGIITVPLTSCLTGLD